MHFTIDQQDTTTIFRLKEARLDSSNSSALKAEFLILAQPDVETLIVDLSEVQSIDSAGLSALLLAERQQSAHGGELRLAGVNENVRSLLRLTQLDRVFQSYPTLNEALAAVDATDGEADGQAREGLGERALRAGALAVGGSFGAAALAAIVMGHSDDPEMAGDDDFEDDDFDDDDDLDEDLEDEEYDDELGEDEDDDEEEEEAAEDAEGQGPEPTEIEEDFDDSFDDDDDDDDDFEDDDDIL